VILDMTMPDVFKLFSIPRRVRLALYGWFGLVGALCMLWSSVTVSDPQQAYLLEVNDAIGPASADFVVRGIEKAETAGAQLVIIRLNTPGGLDTAMRDIIRKILASTVPVAVYVAPSGSRAASAGTYILYASHIAAMAPATNIGAATPVELSPGGIGGDRKPKQPGDGEKNDSAGKSEKNKEPASKSADGDKEAPASDTAMRRKVVNDAVAYIRGLAKMRGRNEEWAEAAVRQAESLTAEDALKRRVIEAIAVDVPDLLKQIDGRTVKLAAGERTLKTAGLKLTRLEPDWRTRLLSIITNPNVAYILMMLGVYGLFFELYNPGTVFPGVTGAICLLLALYAFQVLPVNYAGVALLLLGIALIIGELFVPSFGALGIGGAVSFVIGSIILIDTDVPAFQVSMPLVLSVASVTGALMLAVILMALKQRRRRVVTGREQMLGDIGVAETAFDDAGTVFIHGEIWRARSRVPVRANQRVRVTRMDGLILTVEPLED